VEAGKPVADEREGGPDYWAEANEGLPQKRVTAEIEEAATPKKETQEEANERVAPKGMPRHSPSFRWYR
jgi:hypothetical protein